jgi:imidazolonepropionase-like amidohydrolase
MVAPLALVAALHAQSTEVPAPRQQTAMVLRHADLRTCVAGAGAVADGWIVFDRGSILGIGAEPIDASLVPADAQSIDCTGLVATPGLWEGATTLGLIETTQVEATDDTHEFGDFHPEIRAATATNPDSDLPPVARNAGILMAHVFPAGGILGGHASAMRLDGWTAVERTYRADAGMILHWPLMDVLPPNVTRKPADEQRKARDRTLGEIDRFFDRAAAYVRAKRADPALPVDARFESMRGVLAGTEPLLVDASWPSQIQAAVQWCARRSLRMTLVGGMGAAEVAPLLKERGIPVIFDGVHHLPMRERDPVDAGFAMPKRLSDAGLVFSIATGGEPAHVRHLPAQAGAAVGFGLDRGLALQAITRVAAELAGAGDRYGTLEVGKSATLVLFTGDPLELTSTVRRAWIDGGELDLNDRQKRMRLKYLEKELQHRGAPAAPPVPSVK